MARSDEASPISLVCQEEVRLRATLEETRAQAEGLIEQARREADRRVQDARRQTPELVRAAGERRSREIAVEAQALLDAGRAEAEAAAAEALAALPAAVDLIVSHVMPEPDR